MSASSAHRPKNEKVNKQKGKTKQKENKTCINANRKEKKMLPDTRRAIWPEMIEMLDRQ